MQSKIALALLLAGCLSGHANAAPQNILAKPDGNYEMRAADQSRCAEAARRSPANDLPLNSLSGAMPMDGDLTHTAGAALANVLLAVIEVEKGRGRAQAFCLQNLGYAAIPMTPGEAATYGRLSAAEKLEWERSFLVGNLTERAVSLASPSAPRLPAYRDEPFTQGGLKVDPVSLTVVAGEVKAKGPLLKGLATRWRTATLATPVETTDGPIRIAADAGVVFHQVDYRFQQEPLLRPDTATWCGPVRQIAPASGAKDIYCFTARADGYEIYRPSGQAWFAGPYRDGFTLPYYRKPIHLEERAADDLGAFDLEIGVDEVSRGAVVLAATVRRDGRQTQLWTRRLAFDGDGRAVLPLWTKRLVINRIGPDTIKAELDERGDGVGWRPGG